MKKIFSTLIILAALFCLCSCTQSGTQGTQGTSAPAVQEGDVETVGAIEYVVLPGGKAYSARLVSYYNEKNIVIPDTYNGLPVTKVEGKVSVSHPVISVTLGKNVEIVGEDFLRGCTTLKTVNLGESVKNIGAGAFCGCESLGSLNIPAAVEEIGALAFSRCSGLESISVAAENRAFSAKGGCLISADGTLLLGTGSANIPSDVRKIGEYAFVGCMSLKSISIPASVAEIGAHAFEGCAALKSVRIADGVKMISESAFFECYGLEKAEFGSSLAVVGKKAFAYCFSLYEANVPKSADCASDAFYYSGLSDYENDIIKYYYDVENDCYVAGKIESVKKEKKVFLRRFIDGKPVLAISDGAFKDGGYGVELLYIPDGIELIGKEAFYRSDFADIRLPSTLVDLGKDAFARSVYEKNNGISYGGCVYYGNEVNPYLAVVKCELSVREVVLHKEVKAMAWQVFYSRAVSSVVLPEGLRNIGRGAFGRSAIKEITIPSTVELIGGNTFEYCSKLEKIVFNGTPVIGTTQLASDCPNLKVVEIKSGTRRIENFFLNWAYHLEELYLPASINYIGTDILPGATDEENKNLTVYYAGPVSLWESIEKDINWDSTPKLVKVICSDGELEYGGKAY